MTYYSKYQFHEHWYVPFVDLKGGTWRISIEEPGWVGLSKQLVGGETPFEWMGEGTEDQDCCVSGSTGYLRIAVTDKNQISNLRPTEINNRRVTATRDGVVVWQGFLKMENYDQDWLPTPYELELPIVSALELAKDMPLPSYNVIVARYCHINEIIAYMVQLLGVDVQYLISNYYVHIGLHGGVDCIDKSGNGRQWILGGCNMEHFYDFSATAITPKTIYDVLKTIFYPWGRLLEKGLKWYAVTYDKRNKILFYFDMGTSASIAKGMQYLPDDKGGYAAYEEMNISDIEICSTDNSKSYLAPPKSVTFNTGLTPSTYILTLSEDMISSDYSPSSADLQRGATSKDNHTRWRWKVGANAENNAQCTMTGGAWVRVLGREDTDGDDETYRSKHGMVVPLGISIGTQECTITIKQLLKTNGSFNIIDLTIKVYDEHGWEVDDDTEDLLLFGYPLTHAYNGLERDGNTFTGTCGVNTTGNQTKSLSLKFKSKGAPYIIVPELKYTEMVGYTGGEPVNKFREGIFQRKYVTSGNGTGDELSIDFKTLCGGTRDSNDNVVPTEIMENLCVPMNGFNDDMTLVDMDPRYMLELSAVRTSDPTALILNPILVMDSVWRYIPVAYGMNARDCTVQLKLVSSHSGPKDPELKWNPTYEYYDYNDSESVFVSPTFSKATDETVTFTSTDESIATVDANGVISLTGRSGIGIAYITAETPGNDEYKPGSASVTIETHDSALDKEEANLRWADSDDPDTPLEIVEFDRQNGTKEFESPTFYKDTTADVTFDYDESCVTVEDDGEISIEDDWTGETTISATSPENDDYYEGSTSLVLKVIDTGQILRLDFISYSVVQIVGVSGWHLDDKTTYTLFHDYNGTTFGYEFTVRDLLPIYGGPKHVVLKDGDYADNQNWSATNNVHVKCNF